MEERNQRLTAKAAFLYSKARMVASTDLVWLQSEFDTLTGIFDRVGLWTNLRKTVGMVCRLCRAAGVRADKDYTQRTTEEGWSFKERQRDQVL